MDRKGYLDIEDRLNEKDIQEVFYKKGYLGCLL